MVSKLPECSSHWNVLDDTPPMAISTDSATVTPDTLAPPPNNLLKPIRSIKENSKLFRLHSIQVRAVLCPSCFDGWDQSRVEP